MSSTSTPTLLSSSPSISPSPSPRPPQTHSPIVSPHHHSLRTLSATYIHHHQQPNYSPPPPPPPTSTSSPTHPNSSATPTTSATPTRTTHLSHPLHPCLEPSQHPNTTTLKTLHASLATLQTELNKLLTAKMTEEVTMDRSEKVHEDAEGEREEGEEEEEEDDHYNDPFVDQLLGSRDEITAGSVREEGEERQFGGSTGKRKGKGMMI